MATEYQQDILKEKPDNQEQGPLDAELFAGEVHEDFSEREIFAGDEDFYKLLASQRRAQIAATRTRRAETDPVISPEVQIQQTNFSSLQKVLAAGIIVIAVILVYILFKSPSRPFTNRYQPPPPQQAHLPEPPVQDSTKQASTQIQKPQSVPPSTQPISLKVAQDLYLQADYEKAYAAYDRLRQSLPVGAEEELLKDFLQLKMALCMSTPLNAENRAWESPKADDFDKADTLFRTLLQSRSPVVRMMANYYMGFIELQKEQYLKARTRAYQTIALIDAVDFERIWASSLQSDCYFLIAESMTRHILSLCDADKDLPGPLWSTPAEVDPFNNLNETQLRSLLNSGSEQFSKALLGPKIQKVENNGNPSGWSVACHGAPVDELLARFAANAGLNIVWDSGKTRPPEEEKDAARKKPASLYVIEATTQQVITLAAGQAGLLARMDKPKIVNICNPADYSSLSEHISSLARDTISLWQRFLAVFHSDKRSPNAHFAMGLLQAQRDQVDDAVAEYKLVANRYPHSPLAPLALLHSSKLKTNIHDYSDARQDLKQLVEQYPESELSGRACLHLADTTMKAGLPNEAGRLYSKVYHLGFSLESKITAAFGAGRCFYEQKDYEAAAKWLTRYIELARDRKSNKLPSACFLLGKSNLALGKTQQACDAFEAALDAPAGQLTKKEYVEALSALVETKIQQADFIEALAILENAHSRQFSAQDSTKILLLKSRALQAIGLVDEAIDSIGDRAQYTLDPQTKAAISLELNKCHIIKGNLKLARKELAEILMIVEPGPLAHQIALTLADVCLKLGQNSQTISICSQLLDLDPSEQIKQKALNILAEAYGRQKKYDSAVLALLGKWNVPKASNEKRTPVTPVNTDQPISKGKSNPIEQGS